MLQYFSEENEYPNKMFSIYIEIMLSRVPLLVGKICRVENFQEGKSLIKHQRERELQKYYLKKKEKWIRN